MDNITHKSPIVYRNSLETYFLTMGLLTLFAPSSLFLLDEEEVM